MYTEAAAVIDGLQASREHAAAARAATTQEPERRITQSLRSGDGVATAYLMRLELLMKAIDDPELAATLNTYDTPVPAARLRQYLGLTGAATGYIVTRQIERRRSTALADLLRQMRAQSGGPGPRGAGVAGAGCATTVSDRVLGGGSCCCQWVASFFRFCCRRFRLV